MNTQQAYFTTSEQALYWFMEQKRHKNLIKTSSFDIAKDNISTTREPTVSELLKWCGVYQYPKGKEEVAMVMASLTKIFNSLEKRTKVILMLTYLGDFSTDELYEKARKNQKILKEKGFRVILQYRYTKTKVADMLGINRKNVTRHFAQAMEVLDKDLKNLGFIL